MFYNAAVHEKGYCSNLKVIIIYGSHSESNDIMIIKLYEPLNFNAHVVFPACLPSTTNWDPTNTTCFNSGWGRTNGMNIFRLEFLETIVCRLFSRRPLGTRKKS